MTNHYKVVNTVGFVVGEFPNKPAAIAFAKARVNKGHIESKRTGQITYILSPDRCSCSVCGNELEGKVHCPLCYALHVY